MSVRTSEWRAAHMATQRSFAPGLPSLNLSMRTKPRVDAPASDAQAPPVRTLAEKIASSKSNLEMFRAVLGDLEPNSEQWEMVKSDIDSTEQLIDDWENERARALSK